MREQEVFEKIRTVLIEALNVEPVEVTQNSSLQRDLGAESIDMLDITFRLERTFDIKIDDNKLFPTGIFNSEPDCVNDGIVTSHGIAKLREAMPHCDFAQFEKNPKVDLITDAFTVQSLVTFIMKKMESK